MFRVRCKVVIMMCLTVMLIISFKNADVQAETMREIEPNDTTETSNVISRNNETAYGAANGTYDGQFVVYGSSSKEDTDFYKVYLYQGINYMTCNDHDFEYEIMDTDSNIIKKGDL